MKRDHRPGSVVRRTATALVIMMLSLIPGVGRAGPLCETDLEAFLPFEEGSGTTAADLTGNGHSGTVVSASWGSGYLVCDSEGEVVQVATGPSLQAPSFTYDLWFEAAAVTGAYGRLLAQAPSSNGQGPDVMEFYNYVAMRITESSVVFESPTVGLLSEPTPPDHFGICAIPFHRNGGPEHLVITHHEPSKTVRIFQGLEGAPLTLCFEATYTNAYSVASGPLGICNHPTPDHVFRGRYYQLAYYSRTLTYSVDASLNVISGEIYDNHLAGSAATITVVVQPDAGVPDAALPTDAALPADAATDASQARDADNPDTDAATDDGATGSEPSNGVVGGCACNFAPVKRRITARHDIPVGLPTSLVLFALLCIRWRRRRRRSISRKET